MPEDTTPHGGEVMHSPPDRARIPEPKPGAKADAPEPRAARDRPPLPSQPRHTAADVEDEDADPVVDSGPGIGDEPESGVVSVTRQPGG